MYTLRTSSSIEIRTPNPAPLLFRPDNSPPARLVHLPGSHNNTRHAVDGETQPR